GTPSRPAICTGPSRFRQRNATMRRTTAEEVLLGLVRGRELRSAIPSRPSARYLSAHFLAVRGATMNILAAAEYVQRSSTTNLASRKRVRGVRTALAWDTKTSGVRSGELDSSTSLPGVFPCHPDSPPRGGTTSLDITPSPATPRTVLGGG